VAATERRRLEEGTRDSRGRIIRHVTRLARPLIVAAVSLAIAATGVCASLSAGTTSPSCPVAQSDDRDPGCDRSTGDGTCPEAPAHPRCRTCDDTVAFLLKDKTAAGAEPGASPAHVSALAPRPAATNAHATTSLLHLASISSSPPLHLLNATFRN
jgi:hypothetical protein